MMSSLQAQANGARAHPGERALSSAIVSRRLGQISSVMARADQAME